MLKWVRGDENDIRGENTPPWDGLGCHKNSARRQPCGTKEKEREMRNLFPPIIKQIDERGKRMAKQKDGRYRAKITVGTDASGKSIVKYVSGRTKKRVGSGESGGA